MRLNPLNLAKIVCFAKWVKAREARFTGKIFSVSFSVSRLQGLQPSGGLGAVASNLRRSILYVVLGSRVKVINLNILPESSCNELKYSLKIAFMFLSIILKFQVPDINILHGIRKKATVFDGPWSANLVLGPRLR